MTKFVDTNILLANLEQLKKEKFFLLSSVTLTELEEIKTNRTKTDEIRFNARKAIHFLDDCPDHYKIVVYSSGVEYSAKTTLRDSPDVRILQCAKYAEDVMGISDLVFVSNDILAKLIAKEYFGLNVCGMDNAEDDSYRGFLEVILSPEEIAQIYEHPDQNKYNLIPNQYLIVKDLGNAVVDKFCWTGSNYRNIESVRKTSKIFGAVHPMNGDVYQQLILDSFSNNQITMVKGHAGTGKSYLSIGYLLWLLEKNKIDRIIIFCNTVATVNSAKLGYYPGSKDEKLLDSQIGNMLRSKLGDSYILEKLMNENSLLLLPLSDIRGFDTSGMRAGVYITEAQNMDISLMKLALQRIGEDSICIIDGDYTAQVDLEHYAGSNNGMRRMSEVFRGKDFYGEVELQNIYRSRIAAVAQEM